MSHFPPWFRVPPDLKWEVVDDDDDDEQPDYQQGVKKGEAHQQEREKQEEAQQQERERNEEAQHQDRERKEGAQQQEGKSSSKSNSNSKSSRAAAADVLFEGRNGPGKQKSNEDSSQSSGQDSSQDLTKDQSTDIDGWKLDPATATLVRKLQKELSELKALRDCCEHEANRVRLDIAIKDTEIRKKVARTWSFFPLPKFRWSGFEYGSPVIKLDFEIPNADRILKDDIHCDFRTDSFDLKIWNVEWPTDPGVHYHHRVHKTNLMRDVIPSECRVLQKLGRIQVILQKVSEPRHGYCAWQDLTVSGRTRKPFKFDESAPDGGIMQFLEGEYEKYEGYDGFRRDIGLAMERVHRGEPVSDPLAPKNPDIPARRNSEVSPEFPENPVRKSSEVFPESPENPARTSSEEASKLAGNAARGGSWPSDAVPRSSNEAGGVDVYGSVGAASSSASAPSKVVSGLGASPYTDVALTSSSAPLDVPREEQYGNPQEDGYQGRDRDEEDKVPHSSDILSAVPARTTSCSEDLP